MKIAVNVQPMLHSCKSGIGFYEQELLDAFLASDKTDSFALQYFDPSHRHDEALKKYAVSKVTIEPCRLLGATLYHLIWSVIPVPYSLFFKSKPDVSLFFNYYLPPFVRGKRLLVMYDTVIKDHPETMSFKTRTMLRLTLRRSVRRADRIITISRFSKGQIAKHFGVSPDNIIVIPCAADSSRFYPLAAESANAGAVREKYGITGKYFLYLGNLEPRKNIAGLIDAYAAALKRADSQAFPLLVLAGGKGWQYESFFARVNELGLGDRIIFTGYAADEDVPELMRGAQAFCFPSLYEGFGMPPLEAMACGTPVIVSDCTSLPEVTGECGIKVNPYDTDALADALIQMTDEDFRKEQSRLGLQRAAEFSWEKSAELLRGAIEELMR